MRFSYYCLGDKENDVEEESKRENKRLCYTDMNHIVLKLNEG